MPRGSPWTVRENEMAIDPVFAWLGPLPWDKVPPAPQITEWAKALRAGARTQRESWEAKVRDVLSCLPILTVKSYDGRAPGSVRRVKDGAKGPTVEGPSTKELVERRLAMMAAPRSLHDARKEVIAAWRNLGDAMQAYFDALERVTPQHGEVEASELGRR
jgi:hypothetical protein